MARTEDDSRRVALDALTRFDVHPARVRRLPRGWNTGYDVWDRDGARYVLRVHRDDGPDPQAVRAELAWLHALRRDTDLEVPEPVPAADGDLLVEVDRPGGGTAAADLLRWVDGSFLGAERTRPAHLRAYGRLTAALHAHAAGWATGDSSTRPDPLGWTEVARRSGADPFAPDVVEDALAGLAALDPRWDTGALRAVVAAAGAARDAAVADGEVWLVHADLHHENVLVVGRDAGGSVVGAIDFDDCGDAPLVYDLAVTLSELPVRDDLRAALLEGYAAVRPLPRDLDDRLDALVAFRFVQPGTYVAEHRDEAQFAPHWHQDANWCLREGARRLG